MPESTTQGIDEIGLTAGRIWGFLVENDSGSLNKVSKELDVPRDLILQAVGWLAREDKLVIEKTSRGRMIRLK